MLPDTTILNAKTIAEIVRMGYTRIPVYSENRENVTDILFVKGDFLSTSAFEALLVALNQISVDPPKKKMFSQTWPYWIRTTTSPFVLSAAIISIP